MACLTKKVFHVDANKKKLTSSTFKLRQPSLIVIPSQTHKSFGQERAHFYSVEMYEEPRLDWAPETGGLTQDDVLWSEELTENSSMD